MNSSLKRFVYINLRKKFVVWLRETQNRFLRYLNFNLFFGKVRSLYLTNVHLLNFLLYFSAEKYHKKCRAKIAQCRLNIMNAP